MFNFKSRAPSLYRRKIGFTMFKFKVARVFPSCILISLVVTSVFLFFPIKYFLPSLDWGDTAYNRTEREGARDLKLNIYHITYYCILEKHNKNRIINLLKILVPKYPKFEEKSPCSTSNLVHPPFNKLGHDVLKLQNKSFIFVER